MFHVSCCVLTKGNGIPLIKLNGSLDWAVNLKTGEKYLFFWYIRPETYYFKHEEQNDIEVAEPYFILPHQTKDESMKILRDRARAELRQGFKVTIIGYSLLKDKSNDISRFFLFRM